VYHRREGRPNLVIGNESGKWWAYCQSCKQGGVVEKDHVKITGGNAPASSTHLDLPRDSLPILDLDEFCRDAVLRMLASKNMDQMYLPPIHFSEQRKRMLIDTGQGWLGRDTTGRSPQKWLTYDGSLYLGNHLQDTQPPLSMVDMGDAGTTAQQPAKRTAVVVEDPFSYYKVLWALRETPWVSVFCALGTVIRPVLRMRLLSAGRVVCFFDGDPAGETGARREAKAMRGLGACAIARPAPDGFDPKDLSIEDIRSFIHEM
jgi:DNA primase (bacterial type)